jgi:hypothetical protein
MIALNPDHLLLSDDAHKIMTKAQNLMLDLKKRTFQEPLYEDALTSIIFAFSPVTRYLNFVVQIIILFQKIRTSTDDYVIPSPDSTNLPSGTCSPKLAHILKNKAIQNVRVTGASRSNRNSLELCADITNSKKKSSTNRLSELLVVKETSKRNSKPEVFSLV